MAIDDRNPEITRRKFLAWTGALAASAGIAPLLTACGAPAAQPAATSAPAKAAAPAQPAAPAGVIELKFSHHEPATGAVGKAFQEYADAVNAKAAGKLHITVYPAQTLGKVADSFNNVVNGIADIAWTPVSYVPGQAPLTEAFNLPMLGFTSAPHAARAHTQWFKTNPVVQKEWSEVHVVVNFAVAGSNVGTVKKPVRKPTDLSGMKVHAAAAPGPTGFMKAAGASPSAIPTVELYEALSKGVIEGYTSTWQAVNSNRLYEIVKYIVDMPLYNGHAALSMNKKKWESLTPELQQILVDPGLKPTVAEYFGAAFDAAAPSAKEALKKAGGEIITLTAEEVAEWQKAAKAVWDTWVEGAKGKGFDPQKELETLLDIVAKTK